MKKIISLIICVLMIVPCFAFAAFAEGEGVDRNIADIGSTYATSQWNNDSNARWMIDGIKDSWWQFPFLKTVCLPVF